MPVSPTQLKLRRRHFSCGFSLLELSIVLAVIAIFMGGVLNISAQKIRDNKIVELRTKMDTIESTLMGFRKANNRLPCPASPTATITSTDFGKAATDLGVGGCTAVSPATNVTTGTTVIGVLPTRTLGLSDEYAFDPWGGRFTYAVDNRATGNNAFTEFPIMNNSIGSIVVQNDATELLTPTNLAVAIVLSHGQNGHGAYQLSGARKSAASINVSEQNNCNCNEDVPPSLYDLNNVFVQNIATGYASMPFDDTLRFYTRGQMLSATEQTSESSGR